VGLAADTAAATTAADSATTGSARLAIILRSWQLNRSERVIDGEREVLLCFVAEPVKNRDHELLATIREDSVGSSGAESYDNQSISANRVIQFLAINFNLERGLVPSRCLIGNLEREEQRRLTGNLVSRVREEHRDLRSREVYAEKIVEG